MITLKGRSGIGGDRRSLHKGVGVSMCNEGDRFVSACDPVEMDKDGVPRD